MRYSLERSRTTISGSAMSEPEARAALALRLLPFAVALRAHDDLGSFLEVAAKDLAVGAVGQAQPHVDGFRLAVRVGHPHAPSRHRRPPARPARRRHFLVALALLGGEHLGDAGAGFRAQPLR